MSGTIAGDSIDKSDGSSTTPFTSFYSSYDLQPAFFFLYSRRIPHPSVE